MLTHVDGAFSGGIFSSSKVLMVTFNRETSDITGIIINKFIHNQNRGNINIGGPCDISKITTLHNVSTLDGAVKICDGVYMGGEVD